MGRGLAPWLVPTAQREGCWLCISSPGFPADLMGTAFHHHHDLTLLDTPEPLKRDGGKYSWGSQGSPSLSITCSHDSPPASAGVPAPTGRDKRHSASLKLHGQASAQDSVSSHPQTLREVPALLRKAGPLHTPMGHPSPSSALRLQGATCSLLQRHWSP